MSVTARGVVARRGGAPTDLRVNGHTQRRLRPGTDPIEAPTPPYPRYQMRHSPMPLAAMRSAIDPSTAGNSSPRASRTTVPERSR